MHKNNMKEVEVLSGFCIREINSKKFIGFVSGSSTKKLWNSPSAAKSAFKLHTGVVFGTQKEYEIVPLIPGEPILKEIKGLDEYSKDNQTILREAFTEDEIEVYIKIEKGVRKTTYRTKDNKYYIQDSGIGLGIRSKDETNMKVTNHTLFTFFKELNLSPLDMIKLK